MGNESFKVLVNNEEQCSIWPKRLPIPAGWRDIGATGEKQNWLDYIKETWTDMRPLSLRKQMAAHEADPKIQKLLCSFVRNTGRLPRSRQLNPFQSV